MKKFELSMKAKLTGLAVLYIGSRLVLILPVLTDMKFMLVILEVLLRKNRIFPMMERLGFAVMPRFGAMPRFAVMPRLLPPDHIFSISPIGSGRNSLTLFRTKEREISISFKWNLYSLEGFLAHISNWDTKFMNVALVAIEAAKVHIDLASSNSSDAPCPFCGGTPGHDPKDLNVTCTKCGASAKKPFWNNRV